MIPKIVTTGFKAIHLIYFFTAGPDEVKCWQIRRQSKAPQAAGKIAAPLWCSDACYAFAYQIAVLSGKSLFIHDCIAFYVP